MALSTVTVSFDLHDILGGDFDARRTKIRVYTNVENQTLMDTSTGETRIGDTTVTIGSDGTGSFDTWAPGADGNPISWQTYVAVDYPRAGARDRQTRVFGPYTITANADLADLEEEQAVPAEYLTQVTAELDALVDETEGYRNEAEGFRDEAAALIVADLGTTDAQTEFLIENPSLTQAALGAAYIGTVASASVADGTTNDRAAIAAADTAALAFGAAVLLKKGTHRVASNLTITSPVYFQPGAIIKPSSGVTVTLAGGVVAGQHQIADHTASGLVVPKKVDAYHPAWWGAVNTADDSAAWRAMVAARTASGDRQTVRIPSGTTRLWEVDVDNVHLDARGDVVIKPALASATANDPRLTGHGYVMKHGQFVTGIGGEWSSDSVAGITVVYATGSRSWLMGAYIRPLGAGTIGWLPYVSSGSITPRLINSVIYSGDGVLSTSDTGVGAILDSADWEMTNVMIGRVGIGFQDKRGQGTVTGVHVWGCATNGAEVGDGTRLQGLYTETNGGWGAVLTSADSVRGSIYAWANGANVASTGGVQLIGSGTFCTDNELDVYGDDNIGSHVALTGSGCSRNRVRVHSVSQKMRLSQPVVTTQAVLVDASVLAGDNEIEVRGTKASVVTALVTDNSTLKQRYDMGTAKKYAAAVSIPSNTLVDVGSVAVEANTTYDVTAIIQCEGAQADDLRMQVAAPAGASGHWGVLGALAASSTSLTAASVLGENGQAIGGVGLVSGLLGAGKVQLLRIDGRVAVGATAGTVKVQLSTQANPPSGPVTMHWIKMAVEKQPF